MTLKKFEQIAQELGAVEVKYIWRAGAKSPNRLEDLKKAHWYLTDEIEKIEREVKG